MTRQELVLPTGSAQSPAGNVPTGSAQSPTRDVPTQESRPYHNNAMRAMCIWCFQVLSQRLGRRDLLPPPPQNGLASLTPYRSNGVSSEHNAQLPSACSAQVSSSDAPGVEDGFGTDSTTPSDHKQASLCTWCPPPPPELTTYITSQAQAPLFVTWTVKTGRCKSIKSTNKRGALRGCIGTLHPTPIRDVSKYALKAAFHDSRFSPITASELESLRCHVSILQTFEECENEFDWEIGLHGITMKLQLQTDDDQIITHRATFLPEIPKVHQMTKKTALEHLIRKSGYSGELTTELFVSINLQRFQSVRCEMDFDEFQQLRETYKVEEEA